MDSEVSPSSQLRYRLYWFIFVLQMCVILILVASLLYMILSVDAAYEFENAPHLDEHLYALDHFPGFRVSFSMLVATTILFEIVLRRLRQTNVQNAVKMVISLTAFLISILLFYCVEFYQHMHDRVWDREKEVGILIRIALIGYWVLVAVVTILNSIRAIKYVIFTK